MNRRDFIKGSGAVLLVGGIGINLNKENYTPKDKVVSYNGAPFIVGGDESYLDGWASITGIDRKIGEKDADLRKRVISKLTPV